ncbi:ion transporter [Microcoleus sp. FACHB-53]|nr:ion transporter [Microcoleus sp. FACHB-53]MBD2130156.1 ion transporter [Microcoleus sp. FACHB-1]
MESDLKFSTIPLRRRIAYYLEDIETPIGRAVNLFILGLILLSSAIFVAQTYPIPDSARNIIDTLDRLIGLIFVTEYIIRFWCADEKIKFFFTPFSLLDLVAITPFILRLTNIQFIRMFRWFRILRLIRFINFKIYFLRINSEDGIIFARIIFTLFTIIFIYSGLIYQVEHRANAEAFKTFLDAFYFSVVTMTTVGFGDVTPVSEGGRLLTVLMILTGIALIPWQLGDLIKQLLKTANQVEKLCSGCGLPSHDKDAQFCKICGTKLAEACSIQPR